MNQKGWTNFGLLNNTKRINEKIKLGAKYIIIQRKDILNTKKVNQFFKNKI